MPVIVKCVGSASGQILGVEGQYLMAFDLEAHQGQGMVDFTRDQARARRWADMAAFHADYKSVPLARPLRPDGKPNRPLTATTWEIVTVEA